MPDPVGSYETLRVSFTPTCTTVQLHRPASLNSVSPQMISEMNTVLDRLPPQTRCLVLTGTGRAFSSGGDLNAVGALATEAADAIRAFHASITGLLRRIELLEFPVIASVNGLAVAGGLELVLCCDLVVASDQAVFGDGHARFGLLPGGGGSVRLPRAIGVRRAKHLMYTGETVSAQVMLDWGLVSQVVPHGDLDTATAVLVSVVVSRSKLGLASMKTLIDAGLDQDVDDALEREQVLCGQHVDTPDYAEGLRAFRENDRPRFAS